MAPANPTAAPPTAAPPTAAPANPTPAEAVLATAARLQEPSDLAFDDRGNLFVSAAADGPPQLYKIDRFGLLTVYASPVLGGFSGDGGPAIAAEIAAAMGLAFDQEGNLYVADFFNCRIRRIDRNGIISTVAGSGPTYAPPGVGEYAGDGGPATAALIANPADIAVDAEGNLYFLDSWSHRIRRVDRHGIITTIAGTGIKGFSGDDGPATAAQINLVAPWVYPQLVFDAAGNLYFTDLGNGRVRRIDRNGIITTIAGTGESVLSADGGLATEAALINPTGLAFDAEGNLYVATGSDQLIIDNRIRKIDQQGVITTVAGGGEPGQLEDGGPATLAYLPGVRGIAFGPDGNLYLAEHGTSRVRMVDSAGIITTVAGGAP